MSSVADRVAQHYAMTSTDTAQLTDLLAKAYLTAKVAAYRHAATTASNHISLKHPWVPATKDATHAQVWAKEQVDSIASTYLETVADLIDALLIPSTTEDLDEGFIGGLIKAPALAKGITAGVKAFVAWKAPQIANVATGAGSNAGIQQFITDALDEAGDDASSDPNGVRVRVVPDESSSDECADYAGNDYSLEDAVNLPNFPIHPNCRHQREVYLV